MHSIFDDVAHNQCERIFQQAIVIQLHCSFQVYCCGLLCSCSQLHKYILSAAILFHLQASCFWTTQLPYAPLSVIQLCAFEVLSLSLAIRYV
jgi:hypothetical protein